MTIDQLHLHLEAEDSPSKAQLECIPSSTCRWAYRNGHPKWLRGLDRTLTECKCKLVGAHNTSFQSLWPETSKNTNVNSRTSLERCQSYWSVYRIRITTLSNLYAVQNISRVWHFIPIEMLPLIFYVLVSYYPRNTSLGQDTPFYHSPFMKNTNK